MELTTMYESLGVSRAVYEYGEKILAELKPRFEALDQTAEYNQTKVLAAMQKNKLSAGCFAATTGYGYDDMGREVLEKVYADCFGTEAALVRPQITCGTHALAVALGANLLPGDELRFFRDRGPDAVKIEGAVRQQIDLPVADAVFHQRALRRPDADDLLERVIRRAVRA